MFQYSAKVYNVVDGDTVDCLVDLGFKVYSKQRIRLANINTPERGQPGYKEAKVRLEQLVLDKEIVLTTTKQSKWGYFLGELVVNGFNANNMLLAEGLAVEYHGGTKSPE